MSDLVGNPDGWFSHLTAHIINICSKQVCLTAKDVIAYLDLSSLG